MRPPRLVLIAALAALSAGPASAGFTTLVSFGDSLSDTGNLYAATGDTLPPPPYAGGRFSNGLVWVEHLAASLGLAAPTPSLLGGTNYAFGGSQSGTGSTPLTFMGAPVGDAPNARTQVDQYLAGNTPAGGELFTLWTGANDFLGGQTNPNVVVGNISAAITDLAAAGGRAFVVPTQPRLGLVPLAQGLTPLQRAGLNLISLAFNALLDAELARIAAAFGLTIYRPDIDALYTRARANPGAFGLTNVTDSALMSGNFSGQGFLYWDELHPTTVGHRAIADVVLAAVTPTPAPASLAVFGFGAVVLAAGRAVRRSLPSPATR